MPRIIVAGSINMDVVARTKNHPRPGETVMGSDLHFIPGGKGSNQAVAAGRLTTGETHLIGRLGRDAFGESLTDFLNKEPLNIDRVNYDPDAPSGTALIIVNEESENTIVVISGSNANVTPQDVNAMEINAGDVALCQFEIPQKTVLHLFTRAQAAGARTVLNPAPAAAMIDGLLECINYLIVNETELAFFAGAKQVANSIDVIKAQAMQLRATPEQVIIVTLGARGLVCIDGETFLHLDGIPVKAVDTTGAGDCFSGAFAVAIAEGMDLHSALRFANTAASLSVQKLGASTSMPYRDAVNNALKNP